MRKHLMYTGLCLSLFAFAAGVPSSMAQVVATEDVTVSVQVPNPDIVLTALSFGTSIFAANHATATATLPVTAASVLGTPTGAAGSARILVIDNTGASALQVDIGGTTAGVPSATMSINIRDDNTPANSFITLTGTTTPADATFRVDTWTSSVDAGGGSLTFTPATASGTVTLNGTGEANLNFGATLRTVAGAAVYSEQDYVGTVRVTISY